MEGQHRTHLPASRRGLRGALGGRHGLGDAEIPGIIPVETERSWRHRRKPEDVSEGLRRLPLPCHKETHLCSGSWEGLLPRRLRRATFYQRKREVGFDRCRKLRRRVCKGRFPRCVHSCLLVQLLDPEKTLFRILLILAPLYDSG